MSNCHGNPYPTIYEQMLERRPMWHHAPTKAHPYHRGGVKPVVEGSAQSITPSKAIPKREPGAEGPRLRFTYRAARREVIKQQRREAKRHEAGQ